MDLFEDLVDVDTVGLVTFLFALLLLAIGGFGRLLGSLLVGGGSRAGGLAGGGLGAETEK